VDVTNTLLHTALVVAALQGCSADTSQTGPGPGSGGDGAGAGCAAERCNGVDDDCDGQVDEDDPELEADCVGDTPEACGPGALSCVDGALICVPSEEPVEGCNGVDDDCDGLVDEDFPTQGADCIAGGVGACNLGQQACIDGELVCVDEGAMDETCNGQDDDCDGDVDEGEGLCKKVVFVTSTTHDGNLGGLAGGDAICQARAEAAGLEGSFLPWLSVSTLYAKDRLSHFGKPYVLVDDTVVADDWNDLVDSSLDHAIDMNELGGPPPDDYSDDGVVVWTGTWWDGGPYMGLDPNDPPTWDTCNDWTWNQASVPPIGGTGHAELADGGGWSGPTASPCNRTYALYCFEQ
jgi:hypothetical protein